MKRLAFKMLLNPGQKEEYKKRHDEIWPQLSDLLKNNGVSDYSIFLDEETNTLFAVLKVANAEKLDALPRQQIMKDWWAFMKDVMATNPDNSPISIPLEEVFYLE